MNASSRQPLQHREQAQWLRLRALRVERARTALTQARAREDACRQVVLKRRDAIAISRARIDAQAAAVVDRWAPVMPRWAEVVGRHRAALLDRLERDEYALIDEERKLEAARDATLRCESDLSRALAREGAATTLVGDMRRAQAVQVELATEHDIEDRVRVVMPARPSPKPANTARRAPTGVSR